MSDVQSTVVGLKAQECPGGGWTGMPAELEGRATVADCVAYGVCGCIYGQAAAHLDRLQAALSSACGYMRNASIDLATGCTKATAIRTIDGGLKLAEAALTNQH